MTTGEAIEGGPFERDGRPAPAASAPPRDALREVYARLLVIEEARLEVAVRIERERGFIFPETSVIVRDVRQLAEKLYGPQKGSGTSDSDDKSERTEAPAAGDERDDQADDSDEGDDAESVLARLARKRP